ncbi:MAG: RNA polymerase sigma factor [Actinomycetota bacterium]
MVNRELLERCRGGEPGAFEELVERTHRQVYTLALRLVGDRYEAEDVAQEAYLRVHRSLRGFRGEARFETWLHRIVANVAMTNMRKRGRFGDPVEEPDRVVPVPDGPSPDDVLERDEVRRALASLPPGQRVVVVLKDVYGFSAREIADQIGTSEGAVKVRLHRARRNLKELVYGARADDRHAEVRDQLPEYAEEGHA